MKKMIKIAFFALFIGIATPGSTAAMSPLAHLSKVGIATTQRGLSSLIAPAVASRLITSKRAHNSTNSNTPQRNFGILETIVDLMLAGADTFSTTSAVNGFFPKIPGSWLDTFTGFNTDPKKTAADAKTKKTPKPRPIEQVLADRHCAYMSAQKENAAIDQELKRLEEQRKELEDKKNQLAQTLYFNSDY